MKNKILVELYIAQLGESFNVVIPTNEYVGKILEMIEKSVFELADINNMKEKYNLIDPDTGTVYKYTDIIRDTNIKNSKKIIMF